ncbi:MAG: hypothetical protein AAFN74_05105 [Myxococcota bacterium]
MPSTLTKRNAILSLLLGIVLIVVACNQQLGLEVVLRTPDAPDPFADVALLRVTADLDRGVEHLGEVRWDQGPVVLPVISNPAIRRIVVEGLDEGGRVVASGASPPLDLLGAPPEGAVAIDFTRVGVVSTWPERQSGEVGGRSLALSGHQWLALGGVDASGCASERTFIFGPTRTDVRSGPPLLGGRTGDFEALRLPSGAIVVIGGRRGCAGQQGPVPLRLEPSTGRTTLGTPLDWPPGIAVAALSDSLVLAAGGFGAVTSQTEVYSLDPRDLSSQVIGTLSIPRARSTLVPLGPQRALVLGGQTMTTTTSAVLDASIFEPSRGTTLTERIPLEAPAVSSPAVRTAAGSVLLLSPDRDQTITEVKAVVVKRDQDVPIGDVTRVTVTTSTAAGPVLTLDDGSVLRFGASTLDWIQVLPRQAVTMPFDGGGVAGTLADGLALIVGPEGRTATFNPGPSAVLGWRGRAGALIASEGRSLPTGLVPRRPSAWRLTRDGLEGSQPSEAEPGEWAVATDRAWSDFDLTVDVRASERGRALLLWGASQDRFTYAEVGSVIRVARFGARTPSCESVEGPAVNADAWSTAVRVQRLGRRVTILTGGQPRLTCVFDDVTGWLGIGVGQGMATFSNVRVGLP